MFFMIYLPLIFVKGKCAVFTNTVRITSTNAKLHKFTVIAVAGDVDPGRPQRGQLQHGPLQLSTRAGVT